MSDLRAVSGADWVAFRDARTQQGIAPSRGFGHDALWFSSRIIAFRMKDDIVARLAVDAVQALVGAGQAAPFRNGKGQVMRSWAAIPIADVDVWRGAISQVLEGST